MSNHDGELAAGYSGRDHEINRGIFHASRRGINVTFELTTLPFTSRSIRRSPTATVSVSANLAVNLVISIWHCHVKSYVVAAETGDLIQSDVWGRRPRSAIIVGVAAVVANFVLPHITTRIRVWARLAEC